MGGRPVGAYHGDQAKVSDRLSIIEGKISLLTTRQTSWTYDGKFSDIGRKQKKKIIKFLMVLKHRSTNPNLTVRAPDSATDIPLLNIFLGGETIVCLPRLSSWKHRVSSLGLG